MINNNVSNEFNQIYCDLGKIRNELRDQNTFSLASRRAFNNLLEKLVVHVQNDAEVLNTNQLAGKIVKLCKIQKKIYQIKSRILPVTGSYMFYAKISKTVLPKLVKRISSLRWKIKQEGRLPFNPNQTWELYQKKKEEEMGFAQLEHMTESGSLADPGLVQADPRLVQKELFHWLGEHVSENRLKGLNVKNYEGSCAFYSYSSYCKLVEILLQSAKKERKEDQVKLLDMLKIGRQIALKFFFAEIMIRNQSDEEEYRYYKALAALDKAAQDGTLAKEERVFNETYKLEFDCRVPYEVIINDICHDLLKLIDGIQPGQKRIFNMGIDGHSLLIEIVRLLPSQDFPEGEYQYSIYNTGLGISYHVSREADGKTWVKPCTIKKLTRSAFTYDFIDRLVGCLLSRDSAYNFYCLHHYALVGEANGYLDLNGGPEYQAQKFGTCSYAAVDAWIDLQLTDSERLEKELIKSSLSIKKQTHVIKQLEEETKKSNWKTVKRVYNKTRYVPTTESMAKQKALKDSKILLALGEQYKQKIEKMKSNLQ
ncbi:hypothetical protein [Candidatus Protochlamydia phocaeensis]|uniref:hypothetical protein n=1 Tax=Candidatus Protochlamydia phocaeensis TaxID=1414722 RepID=UPI000838A3E5|nr:hypothetical protein [Candidatus Protochlamydia phocaeensis]